MADLMGPMERRLLAWERGLMLMDRDLAAVERQAVALGQGIWDSWSDVAVPTGVQAPPPPPATGGHVPGCSAALDATLYCKDRGPNSGVGMGVSIYGAVTLNWDGTKWAGCVSGNFPGFHSSCSAVTGVGIFYELSTGGVFTMRWYSLFPATTACPAASSCSSTPNCSASQFLGVTVDSCVPFAAHQNCGTGGGFIIFGDAVDVGVRVDFADTPL